MAHVFPQIACFVFHMTEGLSILIMMGYVTNVNFSSCYPEKKVLYDLEKKLYDLRDLFELSFEKVTFWFLQRTRMLFLAEFRFSYALVLSLKLVQNP